MAESHMSQNSVLTLTTFVTHHQGLASATDPPRSTAPVSWPPPKGDDRRHVTVISHQSIVNMLKAESYSAKQGLLQLQNLQNLTQICSVFSLCPLCWFLCLCLSDDDDDTKRSCNV